MSRLQFAAVPMHMIHDTRLSLQDIGVFVGLMSFADSRGICWPSADTLAPLARVSRATLFRSLTHLEELGYVVRDVTPGKGTVYHLRMLQTEEQFEYEDSHMPKWAKTASQTCEQAEPEQSTQSDVPERSEADSAPSEPIQADNEPKQTSQSIEQDVQISQGAEELRSIWPKPSRRTSRLESAYRQALRRTSHENLVKAANEYARRSETTDLQFVKTLVCWLEDATNWQNVKVSHAAERSEVEFGSLVERFGLCEPADYMLARSLYQSSGAQAVIDRFNV